MFCCLHSPLMLWHVYLKECVNDLVFCEVTIFPIGLFTFCLLTWRGSLGVLNMSMVEIVSIVNI